MAIVLLAQQHLYLCISLANRMPIIAALDESAHASSVLEEARRLATAFDAELYALHVLTRSKMVSVLEKEVKDQDFTENYEVQQIAESVVANAGGDDVQVVVRIGDPASEIVSYADSVDALYVVIGGHRRSPTGKALFGSVAQQVLQQSSVPVVKIRSSN